MIETTFLYQTFMFQLKHFILQENEKEANFFLDQALNDNTS